jgi:hypothetical protein
LWQFVIRHEILRMRICRILSRNHLLACGHYVKGMVYLYLRNYID